MCQCLSRTAIINNNHVVDGDQVVGLHFLFVSSRCGCADAESSCVGCVFTHISVEFTW